MKQIFTIIITILILSSCGNKPQQAEIELPSQDKEVKNGLHKKLYKNGNVKVVVNYKDGKKHGLSTLYYEKGGIQLEIPYEAGERVGISRKYFESGKLYAETPYSNDEINGIRKTYYSNGNLKAEVPYKYNLVGVGTNEYGVKGEPMKRYQLEIKKLDKYTFELSTNKRCIKTTYFDGPLIEGKYLDEKSVLALPISKGKGVFTKESGRNGANLVCKCKTPSGNTIILQKSVK